MHSYESQSRVALDLQAIKDRLLHCLKAATDIYFKKYSTHHWYKSTVFSMIHDLIRLEVLREFEGVSDVRVYDRRNENRRDFYLVYKGCYIFQFKKIDGGFKPSNYKTKERQDFYLNIPIEGLPDGSRYTIGYIPDQFLTKCEGYYIVCLQGSELLWVIPLSEDKRIYEPINLFSSKIGAHESTARTQKRRVRPRKDAKDRKGRVVNARNKFKEAEEEDTGK